MARASFALDEMLPALSSPATSTVAGCTRTALAQTGHVRVAAVSVVSSSCRAPPSLLLSCFSFGCPLLPSKIFTGSLVPSKDFSNKKSQQGGSFIRNYEYLVRVRIGLDTEVIRPVGEQVVPREEREAARERERQKVLRKSPSETMCYRVLDAWMTCECKLPSIPSSSPAERRWCDESGHYYYLLKLVPHGGKMLGGKGSHDS